MRKRLSKSGLRKVLIGFLIVVSIAVLNVFISYFIVKRNQTSMTQMMQIVNPYLESLEKFNMMLTESKMYMTSWVYLQVSDEEKKKMIALQDKKYPLLKLQIWKQLGQTHNKKEEAQFDALFSDFDRLIMINRNIMNLLTDFDDYNDATKKLTAEDILESQVFVSVEKIHHKLAGIIEVNRDKAEQMKSEADASLNNLIKTISISSTSLLLIVLLSAGFISRSITKPVTRLKESIVLLSKGELPEEQKIFARDMLGELADALNLLMSNFSRTLNFATEIGKGNLGAEYVPISEKDKLGNALLAMRNSLQSYAQKMEQKVEERVEELKLSAEALQKSEKKNRDLINYSQALICTHDLSGILLSANPALCLSLGYDEKDIIGKSIGDFLVPEHKDKFQEYVDLVRNYEKSEGIMCVESREGKKKYFFYKNYKLSEYGEQPYIIGFSQDVTRLVMAEKELKKSKAQAEESSKAKELFLASMSHEIRTPMNGILGMCTLLSKTEVNQEQGHYLNLIKRSADNLLVIINDILDISKINSGKLNIESVPFNIHEIIQTAVQPMMLKAKEKEIALEVRPFLLAGPMMTGDPYRLTQILINLLSNALKFTHQGKVELSAKVMQETEENISLEFCVSDTGIGIPKEKLKTIFEDFTQVAADTTRKYGGTGLGLSISRKLVEMQGGKIWAENTEKAGSKFKFTVEYKKIAAAEVEANVNAPRNYKSLGEIKVLLAEDNEVNQAYASALMKKWGFIVDVVGDGHDAVILSQKKDYDVVLMDIQMPGMNGIEAAKLIRGGVNRSRASVPIIALTANVFGEDHHKYTDAGMNDCIYKPFEEDQLFFGIGNCINKNRKTAPEKKPAAAGINLPKPAETSPVESEKLYDMAGLLSIAEGDQEFQNKMVHLFIKSAHEAIKAMKVHGQNKDWDLVRFAAHKVKPNIDRMRIASLKETVRELEKYHASDKEHKDRPQELITKFISVLSEVTRQIEASQGTTASTLAA